MADAMSIDEMVANLTRDFDTVQQRKGPGGVPLDYLSGSDVMQRVMETCLDWSWEITGHRETNTYKTEYTNQQTGEITGGFSNPIPTLVVFGRLTIPPLGSRDGMGVATIEPGKGEDNLKGAETDAFKRAAAKFGVGFRQLYGSKPGGQRQSYGNGGGGSQPSGQPAQQQQQGQQSPGPGGVRGYPASEAQVKYVRDLMRDLELGPDELFARFGPQGEKKTDRGEVVLPVLVRSASDLKSWQAKAIITHLQAEKDERGTSGQTGSMGGYQ